MLALLVSFAFCLPGPEIVPFVLGLSMLYASLTLVTWIVANDAINSPFAALDKLLSSVLSSKRECLAKLGLPCCVPACVYCAWAVQAQARMRVAGGWRAGWLCSTKHEMKCHAKMVAAVTCGCGVLLACLLSVAAICVGSGAALTAAVEMIIP